MRLLAEEFGGRIAVQGRFPELVPLLERIEEACNPVNVILYGSRARGDETALSDWDLKVIVPDDAPDRILSPVFGWKLQEGAGVYADVSCTRLSEFRADLAVANSAASHIVDDGILLLVR
ncbi:nucleotidyltransferase domain-containing protein [Rhizobium sp. G187]|uniref:nucleotidyltransferase domain-containing protein n=1 Tax=Rhizobium sp. G187 TaxID=3451352 RepID=UPI003EE544FE